MNKGENSIIRDMTGIILCYGVLLQIVLLIFAENRIYVSTGLWLGIMLAIFMLVYMYRILHNSLGWGAYEAEKYVRMHSIIRYLAVVLVFGIVIITRLGSPLVCFVGILSLKAAAYLQPVVEKFRQNKKK